MELLEQLEGLVGLLYKCKGSISWFMELSNIKNQPGKPFPHGSELKKTFPPTRDIDPGKPCPP
jgi:hypothetical protein